MRQASRSRLSRRCGGSLPAERVRGGAVRGGDLRTENPRHPVRVDSANLLDRGEQVLARLLVGDVSRPIATAISSPCTSTSVRWITAAACT